MIGYNTHENHDTQAIMNDTCVKLNGAHVNENLSLKKAHVHLMTIYSLRVFKRPMFSLIFLKLCSNK